MTTERRLFRRDAELEIAPGTIIAEFSNGTHALNFMKYCLPPGYTVTAGVNMIFAVRKVCVHPIKYLRSNAGKSECGACGVALESDAAPPNTGVGADLRTPSGSAGGFSLHALTPKGVAGLAHIERVLGTLEVVDERLPHGSNSL